MMTVSCKELRKRAWDRLKNGTYGRSLGVSIVGGIVGSIASVFTMGAMTYGMTDYFVAQQRDENPEFSKVLSGFDKYLGTLVSCILQSLFILLWSILFFIPGIIKTYSYSMMYFVMKDFDLSGTDAITKSRELMKGYKWKLFKLQLSFLGWYILAGCTFGIGALLLVPYVNATMAEFYAELLNCHGITVGRPRRSDSSPRDGGDSGRDPFDAGDTGRRRDPRDGDDSGRDPMDTGDTGKRRDPRDDT